MEKTTRRQKLIFLSKQFLFGLLGAFGGMIVGLLFGAGFGGNFHEQAFFAGLRGYEATGVIGWCIGASFTSPFFIHFFSRSKLPQRIVFIPASINALILLALFDYSSKSFFLVSLIVPTVVTMIVFRFIEKKT